MSMQEFQLDAEETAKLRKKDLRKSADQARLERQREEVLKAKQQAATTTDPCSCTVTTDADDGDMEIDDDGSGNEITSDSEDDSVSENQKVTLNETILILVVLLLPQSGLVCHLLPVLLSSMVFWAIF